MRQVGFAYAHTRLQARLAARPLGPDWQLIETSRDFAQALDAVNHGSLARFVSRLGRESTAAEVEDALRQSWAELVAEVVLWAPRKWRAALTWITPLPHLWLANATPAATPAATKAATLAATLPGAGALDASISEGLSVSEAWRAGLAGRLPAPDPALDRALAPLFDRFLEGPPRPAADTADLSDRLERLFRDRAQEPAAVFAWLGLMAITLERLRGALLLARFFPSSNPGDEP